MRTFAVWEVQDTACDAAQGFCFVTYTDNASAMKALEHGERWGGRYGWDAGRFEPASLCGHHCAGSPPQAKTRFDEGLEAEGDDYGRSGCGFVAGVRGKVRAGRGGGGAVE